MPDKRLAHRTPVIDLVDPPRRAAFIEALAAAALNAVLRELAEEVPSTDRVVEVPGDTLPEEVHIHHGR